MLFLGYLEVFVLECDNLHNVPGAILGTAGDGNRMP